jgi:hypothetical protein
MNRALVIAATLACWPSLALAQATPPVAATDPAAAAPIGVHIVDDVEPKAPLVPRAKDLLGGHVLVGVAVGPTWSLGKLGSDLAAVRGLGTGIGLRADAGVGLSRSVLLGVWGQFNRYRNGDACGTCDGLAFAVGPFVRYHLSQGLRFDPWLSLGGGYRQLRFEQDGVVPVAGPPALPPTTAKFSGIEWLRFELGADYYVWSGLGLRPIRLSEPQLVYEAPRKRGRRGGKYRAERRPTLPTRRPRPLGAFALASRAERGERNRKSRR